MKSAEIDGGAAFPVTPTDKSGQIAPTQCGMTLRDWFAGQALVGIITSPFTSEDAIGNFGKGAQWAYEMADAMLAQRGTEEPEGEGFGKSGGDS